MYAQVISLLFLTGSNYLVNKILCDLTKQNRRSGYFENSSKSGTRVLPLKLFSTKTNRHQFNVRPHQCIKFNIIMLVCSWFTLFRKLHHKYAHA